MQNVQYQQSARKTIRTAIYNTMDLIVSYRFCIGVGVAKERVEPARNNGVGVACDVALRGVPDPEP